MQPLESGWSLVAGSNGVGTGAQARGSCTGFSSPHLTSPCLCPCLAPPCPDPKQGKVSLALDGRVPRQAGILGHLRSIVELTLASSCRLFSEQVSPACPCWRLSSGVPSQKAAQRDTLSKLGFEAKPFWFKSQSNWF